MRDRLSIMVFSLLYFVFFLFPCHGQVNNLNFHFNVLNQSNGLKNYRNPYLSEDSRGYIWIGGDRLNRFDGHSVKDDFQIILPDSSLILDPSPSSKIFEDKDGRLWFTTYSAIYCIDPSKNEITPFQFKDPITNKPLDQHYAFHLDGSNQLWVVAGKKLFLKNIYDSGKDIYLHPLEAFTCNPILSEEGKVLGLAKPQPDLKGIEIIEYVDSNKLIQRTYYSENDSLGFEPARILFARSEGDSLLWLASDIGIIRFPWRTPNLSEVFPIIIDDKLVAFWDLSIWNEKYMWVASPSHGLFLIDKGGNIVKHITAFWKNGQFVDISSVNNLFIDNNENLWVSSWENGIFYTNLSQPKFETFLTPSLQVPIRTRSVLSITQDLNENVLCSSVQDGLFVLDENNNLIIAENYFNHSNNPELFPFISSDNQGNVWLLTGQEIYFKSIHSDSTKLIGKNLDGASKIVQINNDEFLVLTLNKLFKINKNNQNLDFEKIEPFTQFDRAYQMYLGKDSVLFVSDGFDNLTIYKIENYLEKLNPVKGVGIVYGMTYDIERQLYWLATNKGLASLSKNSKGIFAVNFEKRLNNISISNILNDSLGNLWGSTNNRLLRFKPSNGLLNFYTNSDGLLDAQFMPSSSYRLKDGRMAFGSEMGITIVHPDSVLDNLKTPKIHLTDIMINDTGTVHAVNVDLLEGRSFQYEENNLTFHFIGIDFTAPEEIEYRYWLKNFDRDTGQVVKIPRADYPNLPPGEYTLEIFASNSDGIWTKGEEVKRFEIKILPPWYLSWWAISIWTLLLLSLIYAYYRHRVNQIRKKEEMRRKEAEFRQKEAELKQQMAETETAILRLQMNPHFIFNSMNSINSYILKKDVDMASDYLGRFSRLMRMILDLAANQYVSVYEEQELLELYMQTEAMRFEEKFKYEIKIEEDLDLDDTILPTMILQPFVENAIWHGISGKGKEGKVTVAFASQNGNLLCSVEDNGVGRTATAQKSKKDHESKALKITARRLELLEKQTGKPASYQVIDLKDAAGKPTGTKVLLILPML